MLEEARKHRSRLLVASTSEIYGDPLEHPQKESYWGNVNPVGTRSCYDEGKRAAETVATDYRRSHGTDIRIVRIFNTYGPRMDPFDGRVVSNFIRQALSGEPLTIFGNGLQSRSFCYVSDLVEGILAASRVPSLDGPVNLGNPDEFTILELADLLEETLGTPVLREFRPLPEDDPKRRKPDIDRAGKILAWTPHIGLREGISRTIKDFRFRMPPGTRPAQSPSS
jgi:UDP-glucuronate decarboxylase